MRETIYNKLKLVRGLLGFGSFILGGLSIPLLLAWPYFFGIALSESEARLVWCIPAALVLLGVVITIHTTSKTRINNKDRAVVILAPAALLSLMTWLLQADLFSEVNAEQYSEVAEITRQLPSLTEKYTEFYKDKRLTKWEALVITSDGSSQLKATRRERERRLAQDRLEKSKKQAFGALEQARTH